MLNVFVWSTVVMVGVSVQYHYAESHHAECQNSEVMLWSVFMLNVIAWSVVMLSVSIQYRYAESRHAEC